MRDKPPRVMVAADEAARKVLGALAVLACLGLAVGAVGFLPYLTREHARLEPWEAVLVWAGDAVALGWFLHYFVEHYLLRKPVRQAAAARGWAIVVPSLLLGMGCDLAVTLAHMHKEKAAYQTAEVAAGLVTDVKARAFGTDTTKYDLTCRFADAAGAEHETRFTLRRHKGVWNPDGAPPGVTDAVRAGRVPFPVAVRYDPARPGRCWLDGAGWDHGDRLHYFSLCPLLFQAFSLPLFLLALRDSVRRSGRLPWWHDLHKAFPFLIEAAFLLIFGPIELFVRGL